MISHIKNYPFGFFQKSMCLSERKLLSNYPLFVLLNLNQCLSFHNNVNLINLWISDFKLVFITNIQKNKNYSLYSCAFILEYNSYSTCFDKALFWIIFTKINLLLQLLFKWCAILYLIFKGELKSHKNKDNKRNQSKIFYILSIIIFFNKRIEQTKKFLEMKDVIKI